MTTTMTIIAATDFSPTAVTAVERAALVARARGASLHLLHVFNQNAWSQAKTLFGKAFGTAADPIESARERLAAQARAVSEKLGIEPTCVVEVGRASQRIGAYAAAHEAALVVVGEHGENWVRDAVIGGTALKIAGARGCPVLMVRTPASAPYANVLIAVDFSDAALRLVRGARALFPEANSQLMHAYFVPFESRIRLAGASAEDIRDYRAAERADASRRMEAFALEVESEGLSSMPKYLRHGHPAAAILEQAEAVQADLVAVGRSGAHAVVERLLGSVAENVLFHARCDVLVVP